jgi:adenine-specific DNA-methyltransferase
LRDRRLSGFKFRRQYPVGRYIVDFICLEARVVVELDGGQHVDQASYDELRTCFLQSLGLKVVRYWDDDVLLHMDEVLQHLSSFMTAPHPNPLPASGEREIGP